jgi:citrate synthase
MRIDPFWRAQPDTNLTPLNDAEEYLVDALSKAHNKSCFRPNVSSETVLSTAAGSGSLTTAIAAALLTTGYRHAPIYETVMFLSLEDPAQVTETILQAGNKIPGWGGAFQKNSPDPIWAGLDVALGDYNPPLHAKMDAVTAVLGKHGKNIYPNPSAYTAAVAITLQMPPALAVYLFIIGRLDGWCQLALTRI